MKIFRGMPGGQVTVEDGGKVAVLPQPKTPKADKFAWGDGGKESSNLSLALAENVLGDHDEAVRFYTRLKYRTVMAWTKSSQWSISEKDLLSHIDDMRQNERESSQAKAMVAQQPAPVVYEGGGGNQAAGIGSIGRSPHSQEPKPEIPPERRQEPANAFAVLTAGLEHVPPVAHQRPPIDRGEAIPDDWPEKVDGFRATTGDFVTGTRLVYCLVLCGCYSWQDAAQVPEERLRSIPQWGDALMAEMMQAFQKRNISYIAPKSMRQQLVAAALAKLTREEKEAMGLS